MTAQDEGRAFEVEFAKRIGASPVPGSGNKWYSKLDVSGRGVRWSCKLTRKASYRLTKDDLSETFDATGAGGGDGSIPAMVLRVGSPEYDVVVMRVDDFLSIVTERVTLMTESKADQKIRRAHTPILFRE
jgi:hypothetical protein